MAALCRDSGEVWGVRAFDRLMERYPDLLPCLSGIEEAYHALFTSFRAGGKLLVCGNGGSAADSEHMVGELMKGFMMARPIPQGVVDRLREAFGDEGAALAVKLQGALPAIALVGQNALATAISNDTDAAAVFAQQVYGYGRSGDVLLGISTSGNSRNVVQAAQVARVLGLRTVALTGRRGGALAELSDVAVRVPYDDTPGVQERHLPIYHALCIALEEAFFTR